MFVLDTDVVCELRKVEAGMGVEILNPGCRRRAGERDVKDRMGKSGNVHSRRSYRLGAIFSWEPGSPQSEIGEF